MHPPADNFERLDAPTRRALLRSTLAAALCGAPAWLPARATATTSPAADAATSFFANFKGTRLVDQEGKPFDAARLKGRIVLVNFIFTGCSTVCSPQTLALSEMQRRLDPALRERVRLLSVSLDPVGDTPQALKAFAQRLGVDLSGWTFATGRPKDIDRIADALRLFRPVKDVRKPDDHSTALWLVDAAGQMRMRYAGNPPDVPRLAREIAALDQLGRAAAAR